MEAVRTESAARSSDLTSLACERIAESMGYDTYSGRADGVSILYVEGWRVAVGVDDQDPNDSGIGWQASKNGEHRSGGWDNEDDVRSTLLDLAA